jgi:hypothetical protein
MPADRTPRFDDETLLEMIDEAIDREARALSTGDTSGAPDLVKLLKWRKELAPLKPVEVVWIDSTRD